MNLQRIRIQLTALYALLAALAVGLLAWIAISTGGDRIIESAEREAENVVRELAIIGFDTSGADFSQDVEPFNTWRVNPVDEWDFSYGTTWIEPPIRTMAQQALNQGRPVFIEFEQDGPLLAYVEPVEAVPNEVVLTVVDLNPFVRDRQAFQRNVILAALGAIIATTAAAWS